MRKRLLLIALFALYQQGTLVNAVDSSKSEEIWPCSFNQPINTSISETYNSTPLHEATFKLQAKRVALLLKTSDPNAKDSHGRTPLFEAVSSRIIEQKEIAAHTANLKQEARIKVKILKYLLAEKADVNIQDSSGKTPLMNAISPLPLPQPYGDDVLNHLLTAKAKVNLQDSDGQTALILAVLTSNVSAIKKLLAAGADISLKRCDGKTAIDLAYDSKSEKLIAAIVSNK